MKSLLLSWSIAASLVSKTEAASVKRESKVAESQVEEVVITGEGAQKIYDLLKDSGTPRAAEELGEADTMKVGANVSCRKINLAKGKTPPKNKMFECYIRVDSNGKIDTRD